MKATTLCGKHLNGIGESEIIACTRGTRYVLIGTLAIAMHACVDGGSLMFSAVNLGGQILPTRSSYCAVSSESCFQLRRSGEVAHR